MKFPNSYLKTIKKIQFKSKYRKKKEKYRKAIS